MSCSQRQTIIDSSRNSAGLEAQRTNTFEDIKNTLYPQAQVNAQSQSCQIQIATSGSPSWIFLSPDQRIVELDWVDIRANYPNFPAGGRGLYESQTGKIILRTDGWCRETLIHETLHSLSITGAKPDLKRSFLNFFEGLTEFFAGYVMFRVYYDCYLAWKLEQYSWCSVTYTPWVKLWAAFSRFIPISELVKVYFWDGIGNWEAKTSGLLDAIHSAGYPKFGDFIMKRTPTVEAKLHEECRKNFGRNKFESIYNGPLINILDFNQMLCPPYSLRTST